MSEASESSQSSAQCKQGRYLTELQRQAIIASVVSGQTQGDVAKQFGIHRNTVCALCKSVRRLVKRGKPVALKAFVALDRDRMRSKAAVAVEAGLDHEDDPYKRGGLGVQVLKGLGDFAPEQSVNVSAAWVQVPTGLQGLLEPGDPTGTTGGGE